MRIDGRERAGAFSERNSKSMSENVETSVLYSRRTALMQSIELEPVPIHVELSVHCLPLAAELSVKFPFGRVIAALDAIFVNVEKMNKRRKM